MPRPAKRKSSFPRVLKCGLPQKTTQTPTFVFCILVIFTISPLGMEFRPIRDRANVVCVECHSRKVRRNPALPSADNLC